jgi:hypothetical protein
MQTFAARGLAERYLAELRQAVAHFLGGIDDEAEANVRRRIEVEDETAGKGRVTGLVVPGVQFDARSALRRPNLRSDQSAHKVFGRRTPRLLETEVGPALHRMPLEEALSPDAVRRSDDRARASLEVPHHPFADILEIPRSSFVDRTLAIVRPQDLVRTA